jgi:hypothetical protein
MEIEQTGLGKPLLRGQQHVIIQCIRRKVSHISVVTWTPLVVHIHYIPEYVQRELFIPEYADESDWVIALMDAAEAMIRPLFADPTRAAAVIQSNGTTATIHREEQATADALVVVAECIALVAEHLVSVEDRVVGHIQDRSNSGPHSVPVPSGPPSGPPRRTRPTGPTFRERWNERSGRLRAAIERVRGWHYENTGGSPGC